MINTKQSLMYKGFGLNILSEISLPELTPMNVRVEKEDIRIEISQLANQWSLYDKELRKKFVVSDDNIMFEIANTAIFSIQDGKKILVEPMVGAEEDKIRLYILGTCMGAILIQREILPLHGSAVAINGRAFAFIGDSGAGKSTLAAALINEGYKLLSDDVIPIVLSKENIPFVIPTYAHQKLWQESLNQFGMATANYRPLFDRETKFSVPVFNGFLGEPLPLAGVFELVKSEKNDVKIRRIEGLESFRTLFTHTYRNFLLARLGKQEWHFKESAKILNEIMMFQLQRPLSGFTAKKLVNTILTTINSEEII